MKRPPGRLRIIGGEHRSRILQFDASSDVRPTPDRVRQTLFDWLTPLIEGAHCLDLFAGSGALGLEALSRGAAQVTFLDTNANQVDSIRAALAKLGAAAGATLSQRDGIGFLRGAPAAAFDIVFLDPPYDSGLLKPALELVPRVLKPGNRVYLEWRKNETIALPPGFTLLREKKAGQVSYGLATFSGVTV